MKRTKTKICNTYTAKVIPLAFDESMSYYECICNITNHINKEIIPLVEETNETVIELKNYIDDNMLTKNVDDLTYYTKTSDLSPVAITGDYDDLTNKPTIPDVSNFITKDVDDLTYYTKSSDLSSVATTGDYDDLLDKPTIPDVSNFITKDVNDLTYYTLTSSLSTVATSGNYNDLLDKPTIPTVPTNISAFNNDSGYITATDYGTTSKGGTIKANNSYGTQIRSSGALASINRTYSQYTEDSDWLFVGKGTLENVITGKGLINKDVDNLTNYTKTSSLSTVATTGDYDDLLDKPTLFSGSYNDLTDKPTIPTVYDGSLTLKRNGNVVQIFTANNQSNLEADFSVPDITSVDLSTYFLNSWSANGSCVAIKIGSVKILSISVRNGTTDSVITSFPANYRPVADVVLPAQSYSAVGYAILRTDGTLTFSSGFVNNGSNVLISAIYL